MFVVVGCVLIIVYYLLFVVCSTLFGFGVRRCSLFVVCRLLLVAYCFCL